MGLRGKWLAWVERFEDSQHHGREWASLRALGNNRLARTSYIWFVITPLAARALEYAPPQVSVPVGNAAIALSLSLPFSWVVFFFAALFLSLGNLVYVLGCPEIIKRYDSYATFTQEGKGQYQLLAYLYDVLQHIYRWVMYEKRGSLDLEFRIKKWESGAHVIKQFARTFGNHEVSFNLAHESPSEKVGSYHVNDSLNWGAFQLRELKLSRENEAFWRVYEIAGRVNPLARLICFWMYAIGLALLGIVLAQNIVYVIRHIEFGL